MAIDKNLERQAGRPKLPANEIKRYTHTLRVDQETEERLQKQAKKEDTNITAILRNSLNEYLDRNESKKEQ